MSIESHHPAYFQVRFRVDRYPAEWPEAFAIITAHATTGESWSQAENEAADRRLVHRLQATGVWYWRVTGYAPGGGHAEAGWGTALDLESACQLGRDFLQDAIYWIAQDTLSVIKCAAGSQLIEVGSFRDRLDR